MTEHLKNELDLPEIRRLVTALNTLVSAPEESVRLQQLGGGPDESGIEATQEGALKLGVIILNAALEDDSFLRAENFNLGLRSLLTDDSDVGFDRFDRRDELKVSRNDGTRKRLSVFLMIVIAGMLCLALVGFVAWFYWIGLS